MKDIDRTVQAILAAAIDLQHVWHDEDEGGAWRAGQGGTPVSGGGVSNPTATTAFESNRYRDRDRVGAALQGARERLEAELARVRPKRTGACLTRDCEGDGMSAFDGRCEQCGTYYRRNRYEPSPQLVSDWNRRRPRACACSTDCCPDGCLRMIPAGERKRVSDACRQNQSRTRRAS